MCVCVVCLVTCWCVFFSLFSRGIVGFISFFFSNELCYSSTPVVCTRALYSCSAFYVYIDVYFSYVSMAFFSISSFLHVIFFFSFCLYYYFFFFFWRALHFVKMLTRFHSRIYSWIIWSDQAAHYGTCMCIGIKKAFITRLMAIIE